MLVELHRPAQSQWLDLGRLRLPTGLPQGGQSHYLCGCVVLFCCVGKTAVSLLLFVRVKTLSLVLSFSIAILFLHVLCSTHCPFHIQFMLHVLDVRDAMDSERFQQVQFDPMNDPKKVLSEFHQNIVLLFLYNAWAHCPLHASKD